MKKLSVAFVKTAKCLFYFKIIHLFYISICLFFVFCASVYSQSSSATYSSGNISTDRNFTSPTGSSSCPGYLTVNIPDGAVITGVDVSYSMTAADGAWMSEQRTLLRCSSPGGTSETTLASGTGTTAGTMNYSRTGLEIANGVIGGGNINFQLHAGRTWGGSGCGTNYNRVNNNSWTVTVHYFIPIPCTGIPIGGVAQISNSIGCIGLNYTLDITATAYSFGLSDIYYQWQQSSDGLNWNDIPGATNPQGIQHVASQTVYFRLRVFCSNSGETGYSNIVSYIAEECNAYNINEHDIVTTCSALFYDSGGPNGNYSNNENHTITFCSPNNQRIKVEFLSFDTEDNGQAGRDQIRYDKLFVYDGPSIASPPMFEFSGVQTSANMVPIVISSGECVSFRFTSDASVVRSGWEALITCTNEENNIASQYCGSAPNICNLDGYTGTTSNFYNIETVGGQLPGSFFSNLALDNVSFVTFVAESSTVELDLWIGNCTPATCGTNIQGIQMAVLAGSNCNFTTVLANYGSGLTPGNHNLSFTGLAPGGVYYIMVDGFNCSNCQYHVNAQSGVSLAQVDVTSAIICEGDEIMISASGGTEYIWRDQFGNIISTEAHIVVSEAGVYQATISGGNPECPDEVILNSYIFTEFCCPPEGVEDPQNPNNPTICEGENIPVLSVNAVDELHQINWYDSQTNGNLLAENSNTFTPSISSNAGSYIYYAENQISGTSCYSDRIPVVLNILENVTPDFEDYPPYCLGANIPELTTVSNNGVSGSWSPQINNTETTEYTFTPNADECALPTTLIIEIDDQVLPVFDELDSYCYGSNISALPNISNNGINGSWMPEINNTETTEYTFTPNADECALTISLIIEIEDQIAPVFDDYESYCYGSEIPEFPTISNNGINGSWSPQINNTETTQYTFTPNENECAAVETMIIEIINLTEPTFTNYGAFCYGTNIPELPVVSSNGISGSWTPELNNNETTEYTFTPNENQCAASFSMVIEIADNVVPVFDDFESYCYGSFIPQLPNTSNNGVSGSWSPQINNTETTEYTFTPNADECALPTTLIIEIEDQVLPVFDEIDSYCYGSNISTLPNISNNGINGSWMPEINNTETTEYTFTPNADECALTTSLIVEIEDQISPVFDNYESYCYGSEIPELPIISNNGISGSWSPQINNTETTEYTFIPNQNECATPTTMVIEIIDFTEPIFSNYGAYCYGANIPELPVVSNNGVSGSWTPELNNNETTEYTFTPNENECASTVTMVIEIEDNVIPIFDEYGSYCYGTNVPTLPNISNNGISGSWSPQINNTETTEYTFIPHANECALPVTMIIEIESPVNPIFKQFGPYCIGSSPNPLPSISDNGISGTWQPASIITNSPGNYTYTFTPHSNQCAIEYSTVVNIYQLSISHELFYDHCDFTNVTLEVVVSGGIEPYIYNLNSQGQQNTNTFLNLSSGLYTVVVTDNNGCYATEQVIIAESSPITASYVIHHPSCIGNNDGYIEIFVEGGSEPYIFEWDFGYSNVPYIENLYEGSYDILITDANHCKYNLESIILIDNNLDCIVIPNAFTPNGDGINDTWEIENIELFQSAIISVYNKWGQKIFERTANEKAWDGRYNGKLVPTGTYLYVINLFNGNKPYIGTVTVVH